MHLALDKIAEIVKSPHPTSGRLAKGYSIDSRRVKPEELFFAIRGKRFDGHEFVPDALEIGAAGAVVERQFWENSSPEIRESLIPVADTTEALQRLARSVRQLWAGRVVAITGSMGKTTTKEMLSALLSSRFSVHKSPGNLNNLYGLPLSLLDLEAEHQVAVVELAMSGRGEIARLAGIAEPDIGVVTNVAPVHLEFFDSIEGIARAKRELIDNLNARQGAGIAVLNYDDERVRRFSAGFNGVSVTFGMGRGAQFLGTDVQNDSAGGSRFRVDGPGLDAEFNLPLPGVHNVENALAALAAASAFEIPVEAMQQTLAGFKNLSQRGEILTLADNITLLDDCYNSNPGAMERMIEMLAGWEGARRRVVVAGEMLELGSDSPEIHRKVGKKLAEAGIDFLIAVQGDAQYFLEGASQAGLSHEAAAFFPDAGTAGAYCRDFVKAGDVVLVKGSRGVNLEKVIELLKNHHSVERSGISGKRF